MRLYNVDHLGIMFHLCSPRKPRSPAWKDLGEGNFRRDRERALEQTQSSGTLDKERGELLQGSLKLRAPFSALIHFKGG